MTERLLDSLRELSDLIIAAIPRVLTGIALVILALVVAKVIEKILRAILVRVKVDNLVERAGIDKMLHRIGLRQKLNIFLPRLVYFLLLFLFARTAADALGLAAISSALGAFFAYLPNIIAALLLIVIGSAASQFAGQMVTQAARESGIDFAPSLGRLVSALILFIIGVMAVTQLKIDTDIVRLVTSLLLAGIMLAFGLSVGLGARDITRNILAGFYAKKILRVGNDLQIGDQRGVLRAVTATHTLIEIDGTTVSIANSRFLEQTTRQ